MKRKDIEKAFAEMSLEEMSPLLEALTELHHTKKEARVTELEAEIARLRGPRVGNGRRGGGGGDVVGNGRVVNLAKRASPAPKYRGPNGETWAGRGGTPRWMQDLLKKGKKKEDFLIG